MQYGPANIDFDPPCEADMSRGVGEGLRAGFGSLDLLLERFAIHSDL